VPSLFGTTTVVFVITIAASTTDFPATANATDFSSGMAIRIHGRH
jgi:hypothetical protein